MRRQILRILQILILFLVTANAGMTEERFSSNPDAIEEAAQSGLMP